MMIRARRSFYGDEKGVKAGQEVEVSNARGKQLVQLGLAEEIAAPVAKKQQEHSNKAAQTTPNKAAQSTATKSVE